MNVMQKMNRNGWKNLYRAYRVWMKAYQAMRQVSLEEYYQGDYGKKHDEAHAAWMDALDVVAADIARKDDNILCSRLCAYAYNHPLAQYSSKELLEARLYAYKGSKHEPVGFFDEISDEPVPVASWDWSEYRNSPEYGLSAAQIIDLFARGEWRYGLFGACSRGEPCPRKLP